MEKVIVKQDIYNEQGILLIAKDTEIELTEERLYLLNKIGRAEELFKPVENDTYEEPPPKVSNIEDQTKTIIEKRIKDITSLYTTIDLEVLQKSTDVINYIVYECKGEEWHRYIVLQHSYVDWLYEHAINTAIISYLIGNALGYDKKRLHSLCLGAIFHDIGMTLLPKEILDKPSKLTNVEYHIIKNHSEMGYALLSSFQIPEVSKQIILQHHERLDGSGYPQRLKGDELLEESLIVMVAEYFDTATTQRSYKAAEKASNVLKRMDLAKNILPNYIVKIMKEMLTEDLL